MNNNVFIYVLQEKDKFPRCRDLFKTEIFTPVRLSPPPRDYPEEALVPIKRLGFSQRNGIDRRDDINSSESVHVHELTIPPRRGIKRLD